MRFWVGVTDNDWFDFLRSEETDEVNFWVPSGRPPFTHLDEGAPFLFKLKRPRNHVAGIASFVKFSVLPLSLAWDVFGMKNGAATRSQFESMIRPLLPHGSARDPMIGCIILSQPSFWREDQWIDAGPYWKGNVVRGAYFDTRDPPGQHLWSAVEVRMGLESYVADVSEVRLGNPVWTRPRLGQGGFRVLVTDAYQRRCAVTGERTLPVLEAAHILPFAENGPHDVRNGLLLRSDFHKLFDSGLVTVTPDLHFEVSRRIREEWFNGKAYYRLHGQRLASLPADPSHRPSRGYLAWHNENRFEA